MAFEKRNPKFPGWRYDSFAEREAGKERSKAKASKKREELKLAAQAEAKAIAAGWKMDDFSGYWYDANKYKNPADAMSAAFDDETKVYKYPELIPLA